MIPRVDLSLFIVALVAFCALFGLARERQEASHDI